MIHPEMVGRRISALRKQHGYTQAALAQQLNVSPQAVSKWECGQSLPDIDMLMALSYLFDVSIHALLDDCSPAAFYHILPPYEEHAHGKLLQPVAQWFSEKELAALARKMDEEPFQLSLTIEIGAGKKTVRTVTFSDDLTDEQLYTLAPFFAKSFAELLERPDAALRQILPRMRCPRCHSPVAEEYSSAGLRLSCCENHRFDLLDGVVYFDTTELKGEYWSLSLKNYSQYCEMRSPVHINPNHLRGLDVGELFWAELQRLRPDCILDIASGAFSGLEFWAQKIDWPCTVVLTDLSHRILKYNRRYIQEHCINPNVRFVFVSCDCAALPFETESFDTVISFAGFESMQDRCMSGMKEALRVLKRGGHAVFSLSATEGTENSRRWMAAMQRSSDPDLHRLHEMCKTPEEWDQNLQSIGFSVNKRQQVYSELPAPEDGVFPFRNEILQWMAEFVYTAEKK